MYFPRYFENRFYFDEEASVYLYTYQDWANTFSYRVVYIGILYYIVYYLIPMTFLVFATYKLVTTLNETRKKKEVMTKTKRNEKDLTLSLIVVVIIFMVFQIANPIRRLLVGVLDTSQLVCGTFYYYFFSISLFSVYMNSSINFVIYCICGHRFRMRFLNMLKCYSQIGTIKTSVVANGGSKVTKDTK